MKIKTSFRELECAQEARWQKRLNEERDALLASRGLENAEVMFCLVSNLSKDNFLKLLHSC